MFKVVFDGVPALKMIPFEDTDHETLYLSSDQRQVMFKDADGEFVVFDLEFHKITVYHWNNADGLLENHRACAAFYPAETVKVSMAIQVVGVKDAN